MLTRKQAWEIAKLFRYFDAICRRDLYTERIISERDYVSNLATHIRYPYGSLLSDRLARYGARLNSVCLHRSPRYVSATLAPNMEQTYGCDGIIIFSFHRYDGSVRHRVGMYEAKWPRLNKATGAILDKWDDKSWRPMSKKRKPPPPKILKSRFTNELLLQRKIAGTGVLTWEQFFCQKDVDYKDHNFKKYGSTCVLHDKAYRYLEDHPALWPGPIEGTPGPFSREWNSTDLSTILQHNSLSFGYLIYLMLRPNNIAQYFTDVNNEIIIKTFPIGSSLHPDISAIDNISHTKTNAFDPSALTIPVFANDDSTANNPNAISNFMQSTGINSYVHVSFDSGFIIKGKLDSFLEAISRG